jgi:tubulin-folding cofactor B
MAQEVRRYTVHVIDTDPNSLSANGWLEDVSKIQKYEMSDADYAKRENTYKKFKETKQQVVF